MSAWTFDLGGIDKLPECECCGRPIYRPGLCGLCREFWEVGRDEKLEVIPVDVIINPQDLKD